ncbi:protein kinase domain-containing protein [Chiayiivirga flava]|uniref:Serine/threonine-protein kinase n=1 Tax=Chiayiivirga flava TaxID=659595 RepID=A0A7W8G0I8_9GAMM|nr:protein kinase [Chiayiivirga flava]MBB5207803.1 serine/threonine-protein kinase [Chiayiivirga flava]
MTRVDTVLDQALQQPPDEAERFVAVACGDDVALQARVLRLLRLARSAHVDDALGHLFGGATALALASIAPPGPARVGAWRLRECLGSGGMAQVFRAERDDGTVAQAAAVKILWPHQLRPDYVWRFAREREILATLDDPRIARYLDGGVADDGRPWLAIELVDGEPLDRWLQRTDIGLDARLALFGEIAGAVASAHRQMVVHRDLKPANVLVRGDGSPRLLDFGIAALQSGAGDDALTRDYGRLLTPEFASPEQLAGGRVDTRSDVYQLGRLLHLLLCGGGVHRGELRAPSVVLRERDAGWPVRARAVRGDLDAIVAKAVDADPDARYASVQALLDDLRRARSGRPIAARDHGALRRAAKWLRRHWAASGVAAAALLALLAFTAQTVRHADAMAHEARLNRDAAAFIENVLMRAGPSQALSEEVLANASARARMDLADQPALRARMLEILARLRLSRAEMVVGAATARDALDAATQAGDPVRWRSAAITLAELLNYGGELDPAEHLLREVIARDRAANAPDDAYVRIVLADVLHSRGDWRAARGMAEQAVTLGPAQGGSHCMLGMVLRDLGDYAAARAAVQRGIVAERARADRSQPMIATCLDCLGQIDLHDGNIVAGTAALERSAAMRVDRLGQRWSGLVWSHHWLALARHAGGDIAGADALLTPVERRYAASFGERSHVLAYARSDLGWLRRAQGRNDEARRLFAAAAHTLQAIGPDGHPRTAEPLLGLALLAAQVDGDAQAARVHARAALALRQRAMPAGHPGRVRACELLRRLGDACDEAGASPPTALEWLRMQPLPAAG